MNSQQLAAVLIKNEAGFLEAIHERANAIFQLLWSGCRMQLSSHLMHKLDSWQSTVRTIMACGARESGCVAIRK